MIDFKEGDQVSPLRCDIRHTYHYECIEPWFRQKNECPSCRTLISPEDTRLQRDEIESILEERGKKYDAKMAKNETVDALV